VAKDKKDYPLTGTVVSFHSQAETGGAFDSQGGFVGTSERRVYVIKTDSGTLEITSMHGRFRDRTGALALTIGQELTSEVNDQLLKLGTSSSLVPVSRRRAPYA